jgi:hypothetical protein
MVIGRLQLMSRQHHIGQHEGRPMVLVIGIGLGVAPVLELNGVGIGAQGLVEHPVVHRQLDDDTARAVPADDVAVLDEVVEQRTSLGVRRKLSARLPWQSVRVRRVRPQRSWASPPERSAARSPRLASGVPLVRDIAALERPRPPHHLRDRVPGAGADRACSLSTICPASATPGIASGTARSSCWAASLSALSSIGGMAAAIAPPSRGCQNGRNSSPR